MGLSRLFVKKNNIRTVVPPWHLLVDVSSYKFATPFAKSKNGNVLVFWRQIHVDYKQETIIYNPCLKLYKTV